MIHYPVAPHRSEAYREFGGWDLPLAECLSGEVLSLPMGPHLTREGVDSVVGAIGQAT